MTEKLTFEQSMERLEQIARTLEKGETGLEEAMELYAQAGKLIVSCQKKLASAQLKIEKIDLPSLAGTKEADGDEQLLTAAGAVCTVDPGVP